MEIKTRLRKWGNSFGIVVPVEFIKMKNLKEGEEIIANIEKQNTIKEMFGSLKDWDVNFQKERNKTRKEEWENGKVFS